MGGSITFRKPDDWHIHLREGDALIVTVPDACHFSRVLVMPNLKTPVVTAEQAMRYRDEILSAVPAGASLTPMMMLYLTDSTPPDEIRKASELDTRIGVKLYPAGATTNSDSGVTRIETVYPVLEAMEKYDIALSVHGEVTDSKVDVFDREAVFIETQLIPLLARFPGLRVVFEHITTREAVDFVEEVSGRIGATITAHHLYANRNALLSGGIRPHYYCLPVLKREEDRQALLEAATSGNPRFFLGTDSAPHPRYAKESPCGCAGIYSANTAIEHYVEVFHGLGKLDRFEDFASRFGAEFHGFELSPETITLVAEPQEIPESITYLGGSLIPFRAGLTVPWRLMTESSGAP